ncbi:MAG: hypothetical protein HFI05_01920 [Lachnospiraceae bacterium]|jgi:hypothetical protein|nr:hypothetical protein [Lachnospiraceae bacterium]
MLAFKAAMIITEDMYEERVLNNYRFYVYKADVAGIEMPIFVSIKNKVEVGDCIYAETVYLTNYKENIKTPKEFALRLGNFKIIDKDNFVPMSYLNVIVHGKLVKTEKAILKKVGAEGRLFLACTLCVKNERKKEFNMLIVSFNKIAKEINKLSHSTYLDIEGRLVPTKYTQGFEIRVSKVTVVDRNKNREGS